MNRISFGKKIIAVLFAGIVLIATVVFCAAASKKSGQNSPAGSQALILTNEDYLPALLRTIDEAQNEIFISIFSFKAGEHKNSCPDRILDHLAKALKRGVKVRLPDVGRVFAGNFGNGDGTFFCKNGKDMAG
ncbi:MAG: hypothetical protein WA098_07560 [Smithella sp.]